MRVVCFFYWVKNLQATVIKYLIFKIFSIRNIEILYQGLITNNLTKNRQGGRVSVIFLGSFRVWFSATNLWFWTKHSGHTESFGYCVAKERRNYQSFHKIFWKKMSYNQQYLVAAQMGHQQIQVQQQQVEIGKKKLCKFTKSWFKK